MERTVLDTHSDESALAAETVAEAFARTVRAQPDRVALRTRGGAREISWAEYGDLVERFALALRGLGLAHGDTIALMLTNRPAFHIADSAAITLGATPFSVYQTLAPDQIAHQLADSAARVIVTEPAFLDGVVEARGGAPGVEHVVVVHHEGGDGLLAFDELLETDGDRSEIE